MLLPQLNRRITKCIAMSSNFFKQLEQAQQHTALVAADVLDALVYNADGLIPCIAQQHDTKEVLMMAWMNRASIEESLATGKVCYWSRSRQCYWRKGESSGNRQALVSLAVDCDGDALLAQVDQTGAACHTFRRDCFYISLSAEGAFITSNAGSGE